jgi:hypothetical protein
MVPSKKKGMALLQPFIGRKFFFQSTTIAFKEDFSRYGVGREVQNVKIVPNEPVADPKDRAV